MAPVCLSLYLLPFLVQLELLVTFMTVFSKHNLHLVILKKYIIFLLMFIIYNIKKPKWSHTFEIITYLLLAGMMTKPFISQVC